MLMVQDIQLNIDPIYVLLFNGLNNLINIVSIY